MSKQVQKADTGLTDEIVSSLVLNGDLSKLSPQQKVQYYKSFCERLGLDSLSQPFKLLRLNGKEVMYCDRSGAQQLNKLHQVSHEIKARETVNGCYVVTCQAIMPDGRHTESIGAVPIDNLKGDALCNAFMKAETKAKRRATLDLLGLGILDETETETIPNAQKVDALSDNVAEFVSVQSESAKPLSPFKKKYDTEQEVANVLDTAASVQDIANLYYINAEMVEGSKDFLRPRFSEKKNSFYSRLARMSEDEVNKAQHEHDMASESAAREAEEARQ